MKVNPDKIYTRNEVMKLLQIGDYAMTQLVKQGRLKPTQIGMAYRFLGSEILGFMSQTENKD